MRKQDIMVQIETISFQIHESDSAYQIASDLALQNIFDLADVLKQGASLIRSSNDSDIRDLQDSYREEREEKETCFMQAKNTFQRLKQCISETDDQTMRQLLGNYQRILNTVASDSHTDIQRIQLAKTSSIARSKAELSHLMDDHRMSTDASYKEYRRCQGHEETSEKAYSRHNDLLKKYVKDIHETKALLIHFIANDENVRLMAEKVKLIDMVNGLRNKIHVESSLNHEKILQLSRSFEACRSRLQTDLDAVNDVQRLAALCQSMERKLTSDDEMADLANPHRECLSIDVRQARFAQELKLQEAECSSIHQANLTSKEELKRLFKKYNMSLT